MSRLRRAEGFALVEVLASLMVLAIGIFSAVGVFVSSQKASNTAQRTDVAVALGTEALEEMRSRKYSDVAVSQYTAGPFPTDVDGNPRDRILANGKFDTKLPATAERPRDAEEEFVPYAAAAPDVPSEYQERTVGSGPGMLRARIWRFVSWRDEECELVDLGDLGETLANVKATLEQLVGEGGLLSNLTSPGVGLEAALTSSSSVLGRRLVGSLLVQIQLALVFPHLTELVNNLDPLLIDQLDPLEEQLSGLLDEVEGIELDELVGVIDLCDIPPGIVPDLSRIAAVNAALTAIKSPIESLSGAISTINTLLVGIQNLQLSVIVQATTQLPGQVDIATSVSVTGLNAILAGVEHTLGDTITLDVLDQIAETAGESLDGVQALLNTPDHTHNTKRISVAVQLLPNARGKSVGPSKPVWMSTVVHDPEDGLL